MPDTAVISCAGLSHAYGKRQVLQSLDLDVPEGALYALLGANGAGKTTLLRLLVGIERVQRGTARLFDTPVEALTMGQRQQIAFVAEGQQQPDWMRLAQLEAYCAPLYPTWDRGLAGQLRQRFDLDPSQKLGTMSRGQRMKAALLCALAPRPRLLLMDEPFTGMDIAVKDELVRGLLDVAGAVGQTVLISTHDIAEIEHLVDAAGFLRDGRVAVSASLEVLREQYRRIELTLATGDAGSAPDLGAADIPSTWMTVERSGARLTALVRVAHAAAPRTSWLPAALAERTTQVEERGATLRELYLALAAADRKATPRERAA